MFKFSYEKISAFLPRKIVNVTNSLMVQGGFKRISPRAYIGFSLFFSLLIGILSFFAVHFFTLNPLISSIVPIAVFGTVETLFYVLLIATAEARARQIEEALPHALQIISSNIRAGM